MGSQIVSSESNISHPILVYLSRNNNSQAQARRFQLWQLRSLNFQSFSDPSGICWRVCGAREAPAPRDFLNFRRTSLLSRNEFENGTFTIVLHATFSFTYVSVIYGTNFPFKVSPGNTLVRSWSWKFRLNRACKCYVISPRKCDIWVSSRATSCAPVSMVSHARFRFCLGNNPFSREKVSRSSKLQWLVVVRGETESDRSPCQLQFPRCMNCRLTQGQLVVAAAAATPTSYQWHRGKASNMSDEGPCAWGGRVFFCQEQEEWVSERGREREARQIDKTGVCLIAIKTSKRFAFTASAFRLVSGDFQSSGKGRSYKNW